MTSTNIGEPNLKAQKICPLCGSLDFAPTEDIVNLSEVLNRWEKQAGVQFRQSVWDEYTQVKSLESTLYHCHHCDFGIFQPPIMGSNDFYEDITETNYYISDKWEHYQAIKDLKNRQCISVFDYGCGSGNFLRLLKDKYPDSQSVGYEYAAKVADLANSHGLKVFTGKFPESVMNLKEGTNGLFDAITCFQVLEHVADPLSLLKQLSGMLKKGGFLAIGVPDEAGPIRTFSKELTCVPPHHVSRWTKKTFETSFPFESLSVVRMANEPLPNYLWPFYLPVMWGQSIWPAYLWKIFHPLQQKDRQDQVTWFIEKMNKLKVRWLPGVPGHTIYILLQKTV